MGKQSAVDRACKKLETEAADAKVELHASFFTELRNYSAHEGVADLPEDDLEFVIEEMGRMAIRKRTEKVGGGMIRDLIYRLCEDPFSDCSAGAKKILTMKKSDYEAGSL